VSDATVKAVNIATNLEVVAHTKNGAFQIPDLPVEPIESPSRKTVSKRKHTRNLVSGSRTTTVTRLCGGLDRTTVEVNAVPLMNQVDTTIGYVVDSNTIETTPLGTAASRNWRFLALVLCGLPWWRRRQTQAWQSGYLRERKPGHQQ